MVCFYIGRRFSDPKALIFLRKISFLTQNSCIYTLFVDGMRQPQTQVEPVFSGFVGVGITVVNREKVF